jgi:hypothetical protein
MIQSSGQKMAMKGLPMMVYVPNNLARLHRIHNIKTEIHDVEFYGVAPIQLPRPEHRS